MKFVSTRIITADVTRLVEFYELVTGAAAVWGNELFAEIPTPVGTLAIGSHKTVPLFGGRVCRAGGQPDGDPGVIVDDVDAEYGRLREHLAEVVTEPTTMPWGNRASVPRPGRQPRQPVHSGHRAGTRQVRGMTPTGCPLWPRRRVGTGNQVR